MTKVTQIGPGEFAEAVLDEEGDFHWVDENGNPVPEDQAVRKVKAPSKVKEQKEEESFARKTWKKPTLEEKQFIKEKYEEAAFLVLEEQPYLYYIISSFKVNLNCPDVPIAAVSLSEAGPILYLRMKFAELSLSERIFVIKHEALHIQLGHLPRGAHIKQENKKYLELHKMLNIAMDLVINPMCRPTEDQLANSSRRDYLELPKDGFILNNACWPKDFGYEEGLTFMEYLKLLLDDPKVGSCTLGDLLKWIKHYDEGKDGSGENDGEGCEIGPEIAARINKYIMEKALKNFKQSGAKGAGTQAAEYEKELDKIFGRKKIDWKNKLKMALCHIRGGAKEPTRMRPNRRRIKNAHGTRKGPTKKVGVVLDVSGSMSDNEVQIAFDEIDNLAKREEVYVIQVDAAIQSVEKWKKGQKWQRNGCGGTVLTDGFKKFEEMKFNAVICITDGGLWEWPPYNKHMRVIWVSTVKDIEYPYGDVVYVSSVGNWWEH